MATDIERLIVSLEASTTKYERALAKANGETERRVRSMQRRFDGLGSSVKGMESRLVGSFGTISRAFGVLGIALTTTSIISMTSAWSDLNSRVINSAGSIEKGAAVLDQLSVMARRTYSSLEQTAEGYIQNEQALSALGYSTQQQLDLVETLNNALVISAARGQVAQSVMEAWTKAMADGKLSGQNLNTIIQRGGRLSKALADSMSVSVNELRKLGSEGKITADVMYGVTNQLETLRAEADAMPATVSDGFLLLKDAVFQFVGEADAAVGSSTELAEALIKLSDAIKQAPDSNEFDKFFKFLGDGLAEFIEEGAREVEFISDVVDALSQKDPADVFVKLNEALGGNIRTAEEYELALMDAEQALANLATNTRDRFGEADAAAQDLFQQILEGRGTVEKARKAVEELAKVNPEFAELKGGILSVIEHLFAMRDAAISARDAAANITADLGSMPSWRQFRREYAPDLSNDGAPGGPIKPTGGGSKSKSPAERYGESVADMRQRLEFLKQETALVSALNPLINDYGYAKQRLKAIQDLENAARRAGLELGPAQRQELLDLADAYATATADAARLAEAQQATVAKFDELKDAARSALETIVDGFIEGKSAGDIFADVLKNIGSQLLQMGFNGLFGGGSTPGNGLLDLILPKREFGGPVRKGQPYIVGEKRPEVFVPDQSGTIIPRVPIMPSIPAANQNSGVTVPITIAIDATGADAAGLVRVNQQLAQLQAELPGRVKQIVRERGRKWR